MMRDSWHVANTLVHDRHKTDFRRDFRKGVRKLSIGKCRSPLIGRKMFGHCFLFVTGLYLLSHPHFII